MVMYSVNLCFYLNTWDIEIQNKGSLDGVTRKFEIGMLHIPASQGKYLGRTWSCDPSNFSKFKFNSVEEYIVIYCDIFLLNFLKILQKMNLHSRNGAG